MDPYVIGLFAFVVCVLVSRVLSERAFRALPADQKVTLMDGFSGMRAYSMIPVLGILAVMFGLPQLVPAHPSPYTTLFEPFARASNSELVR